MVADYELKALEEILISKGITTREEIREAREKVINDEAEKREEYYKYLRY